MEVMHAANGELLWEVLASVIVRLSATGQLRLHKSESAWIRGCFAWRHNYDTSHALVKRLLANLSGKAKLLELSFTFGHGLMGTVLCNRCLGNPFNRFQHCMLGLSLIWSALERPIIVLATTFWQSERPRTYSRYHHLAWGAGLRFKQRTKYDGLWWPLQVLPRLWMQVDPDVGKDDVQWLVEEMSYKFISL